MVGWGWNGGGIRTLVGVHLKEIVWLILNDNQIMLLCHRVYCFTTLGSLGSTCWIVTGTSSPELETLFLHAARGKCDIRHTVKQKWLASSPSLLIPIGEEKVQVLWDQPLLIQFHWSYVNSHWKSRLYSTRERILLCNQVITALEKHPEHNLQGGCATNRGDALPVLIRWVMEDLLPPVSQLIIEHTNELLHRDNHMPQCAR